MNFEMDRDVDCWGRQWMNEWNFQGCFTFNGTHFACADDKCLNGLCSMQSG